MKVCVLETVRVCCNCQSTVRDGNGLDLIQDPHDPNPIGSDLDRFKMDLDQIWILMCGSKTDLDLS